MKKLGLLVMPLMTVSLLASCGSKPSPTPTEDVKFSVQESIITLEDKTATLHLDWEPSSDIIEFSNFTFTLKEQTSITSKVIPVEVTSRPLELTVTFNNKLSKDDVGELKFHFNDKTSKKEGYETIKNIAIDVDEPVPPTPTEYDLEVTCANCIPSGNKTKYEEGESVSFTITPEQDYKLPEKEDVAVTGVTSFEYTITSGVATFSCTMPASKVTVTVTATPVTPPGPTGSWTLALDENSTKFGDLQFKDQTADSIIIDEFIGVTSAITMTFVPEAIYRDTQFTITTTDSTVTVGDYSTTGLEQASFSIQKEGGFADGNVITLHFVEPEPPVTAYSISMTTVGTTISPTTMNVGEAYNGTITVTNTEKILDGDQSLTSVKLKTSGEDITSHCTNYNPSSDYKSATFTIPADYITDDIEVTVSLKDKPASVGTVYWKNWDGTVLETDKNVPIGSNPSYDGATPTRPTDASYVYRFTSWTPTIQPVVEGDNVYTAVYDNVPITDIGAEFKLVIPSTNADKTFTFTCNGSKKLTVDWGDTTVDNNNSHTYASNGTYNVSIYREDITNVNVTDGTSKSYINEIKFKDKITSIANESFSSCANLTSINIAKNVTSIGTEVFSGCNALSTIVVASGNSKYDSRKNCNAIIESATNTLIKGCKASTIPDTVVAIGKGAFKNCSNLENIVINEGVTSIGDYAFANCSSLAGVIMNYDALKTIGDYAFTGCAIAYIFIPDGVTSIGSYAFSNCNKLKTVNCFETSSLSSIGEGAFSNCTSLSSIDIPEGSITSVGTKAFENCNLTYTIENNCKYLKGRSGNTHLLLIEAINDEITSATIHDSCKIICDYAFCNSLTTVIISDSSSLVNIGIYAFAGSRITTIKIPNSVTSIADHAFDSCGYLTTILISNSSSLVDIGDSAFSGCSSLTSITIPSGVTSIGNYAFYCCFELSTVTFTASSSLLTIGEKAFQKCKKLTTIKIPDSVTSIGTSAFENCTSLTTVIINSLSSLVDIGDSAFGFCSSLTSIAIPSSVTSIGVNAFYDSGITSINIPDGVTSIAESTFRGCLKLVTITFTDGSQLTSIGGNAFQDCSSLISIIIPSGVTSIGNYAFYGCSQLQTIIFAGESKLTSIGDDAFEDCSSLTSINIPSSVTSIGSYAFRSCSNLKTVDLTVFTEEASSKIPNLGYWAFDGCHESLVLKVANADMAKIFKNKVGWKNYADKIQVA